MFCIEYKYEKNVVVALCLNVLSTAGLLLL